MHTDLTPLADHFLVAVPQRVEQLARVANPENGVLLTSIRFSDDLDELTRQIKAGEQFHVEDGDEALQTQVRVGTVLRLPSRLTTDMTICAGGLAHNGRRVAADFPLTVKAGEELHCENMTFTPEQEVAPSIFRVPYSAAVCVIEKTSVLRSLHGDGPLWGGHVVKRTTTHLRPLTNYVLLTRIWPDDAYETEVDGFRKMVRRKPNGLLEVVTALPNEGIVAYVAEGVALQPGQRVLCDPGQAIPHTIAGSDYLAVRADYVAAVREPEVPTVELGLRDCMVEKLAGVETGYDKDDFVAHVGLVTAAGRRQYAADADYGMIQAGNARHSMLPLETHLYDA